MEVKSVVFCRSCLSEVDPTMTYSFGLAEIRSLFLECTSIQISELEEQRLPQQICQECFLKCHQWDAFRKMSLEANARLLESLSKVVPNPPTSETLVISSDEEDGDEEPQDVSPGQVVINNLFPNSAQDDLSSFTFGELIPDFNFEGLRDEIEITPIKKDSIKGAKPCQFCQKPCPEMCQHIMDEHVNFSERSCPYCGKRSRTVPELKRHIFEHTGESPQISPNAEPGPGKKVCPVCRMKFSSTYAQLAHTVVHTKERPFVCNICNDDFTQAASVRRHLSADHTQTDWVGKYHIREGSIFQKQKSGEIPLWVIPNIVTTNSLKSAAKKKKLK